MGIGTKLNRWKMKQMDPTLGQTGWRWQLRASAQVDSSLECRRQVGQEVRARQQLVVVRGGYTAWRGAKWVRVILQQVSGGNTELARLAPWGLQLELGKYSKSKATKCRVGAS